MDWLNSFGTKAIEISAEINQEIEELRTLGLTEIEIEGYIEFYWENWFEVTPVKNKKELN